MPGNADSIKQSGGQIEEAVRLLDASMYREAEHVLNDIVRNDLPGREKAFFLLGRLYRQECAFDSAEKYLLKASTAFPLLRDYALKELLDVYSASGRYDRVMETAEKIKNRLLQQDVRKATIDALLAMQRLPQAKQAFSMYVRDFPDDWDYRFSFAARMKEQGELKEAAAVFRDIYISAAPLSEDALEELRGLKAAALSKKETLKRADNLFANNDFKKAEALYREVYDSLDKAGKERVAFQIGMCRFRQKKYGEAAASFGRLHTPRALYWQARSFYRMNDLRSFNRIKNSFEKKYPGNRRLALLFLMEGDEFRRKGRLSDAAVSYRKVVKRFPARAESALWGLAWMYYTSGDYRNALTYFSRLAAYTKSRDYYKYLYWRARTEEKLSAACAAEKPRYGRKICGRIKPDPFRGLPADESYYGYLIRLRSSAHKLPEKVQVSKPARPAGRVYERIEALVSLGMKEEAVNEITDSLKRAKTREEFFYLGHMAMKLQSYRDVIALAEPRKEREFLPYSYPLGFRDIIIQAAHSENVDAHLIAALIREESRYDPEVVSWAGAVGLMQLMPSTAEILKDDMDMEIEDSTGLFDARKNILLGTHYFSRLVRNFNNIPLAIAAYNAGEKTLRRWMARFNDHDITEFIENIPYKETRRYVKKVLKSYWQYRTINGLPVTGISGPG
ncbi:MAG: transglycosylase SLT domain-containing protein [Deferribacteres bacterium]|nr:transglycosylase SLT domain-containing protein [Deferribacteres bacterium]